MPWYHCISNIEQHKMNMHTVTGKETGKFGILMDSLFIIIRYTCICILVEILKVNIYLIDEKSLTSFQLKYSASDSFTLYYFSLPFLIICILFQCKTLLQRCYFVILGYFVHLSVGCRYFEFEL